ncbi:hypothetical protein CBG25_17865 [Arsenophonus sp. ENCA]|uniref:hypothetical protein n=1 Tax=Arsenophonus sp. ENCA TaxID=1987579 RepID=UPI000BD9159A|nr:hypothetical protein [Arsenophonus sp. ENCA]PAV01234.1 hypothetical protein CBG25_17865 [Arsenophonus sp. ENCA]
MDNRTKYEHPDFFLFLNLYFFFRDCETRAQATFTRGIKELVGAQIIARCLKQGDYFINPNFIFNGDRVAFTTAIEKQD